ncbi:helix-turn-helix domain-containing protein [Flammeovirga sp. OC4]|uniref:helix-turn-helix domain-containing protein n=1 Tax=Flammeovirga sp. OC4 TaxID=1382345 RepID=UPI0005C68E0B|nr:helix-turn-helix transcriptional regulator [Flammeovirga sp. OC4]
MDTETKILIGQNIKDLRTVMGLSQDQVAKYLDVTREQVSNYERAERNISIKELNKLADLFGVELSDLLEEDKATHKINLAFAFRKDGEASDLDTVSSFKKVVMNYLKMEAIQ